MITTTLSINSSGTASARGFILNRSMINTYSLTILNAAGLAPTLTDVLAWEIGIHQDFDAATELLAGSADITATQNVLAISISGATQAMADYLDGKKTSPAFATLKGFNGSAELIEAYVFPVTLANIGYDGDDVLPASIEDLHYTQAQIDAMFADIAETLTIPTDISELADEDSLIPADLADLTDETGILAAKADAGDIPADLSDLSDNSGILAGKVDKVTGKGLSANDYTDAAVIKVATIQLETLATLSGTDVSVAPWTQSKWSASGTCSLTATGWAASGRQTAYIVITLAAEAIPSIIGTEAVEDGDALSAAGVYECFLKNVDGKIYFRQISFTEAVA